MAKWIKFEEVPRPEQKKTKIFIVKPLDGGMPLGEIKWHGPWRAYCFFPASWTLYEKTCLRDIADFCESETLGFRTRKQETACNPVDLVVPRT